MRIVFLIFPKTHLLDLAGIAQVFYEANSLDKPRYKLFYAGIKPEAVAAQGMLFANLEKPEDLNLQRGDMICIPGIDFESFSAGEMDSQIMEIKQWIKTQHQQGVCLSSICTGALILGRMGLLNGIKCTTHWKCLSYARRAFPNAKFLDERLYCFDKHIFTSAGMTSGIDMALALIEKWDTPLLAAQIVQEMVINIRRAETRDQQNTFLDFKNHFNPLVYKAQEILADRLEVSFTAEDLATELNVGYRQLSRLFKSHTGQTIHDYREECRFNLAEKLLYNTELSVKEIAIKCGYDDTRQITRLWKERKGLTLVKDRESFVSS